MLAAMNEPQPEYVGFWPRVGAAIIDSILAALILTPLMTSLYGSEYELNAALMIFATPGRFFFNGVLPAVAVVLFWICRQATPGTLVVRSK